MKFLLLFSMIIISFSPRVISVTNDSNGRQDIAYQLNIPLSGSLQNPAFSPDNKSILFTRFREGYNSKTSDLFIYNLETETLRTLVSDNSSNVNLPGTSWNPVNQKITFSSERGSHDEIFTISETGFPVNGSQLTKRDEKQSFEPSFSPDGQWVVFETHDIDVEQGIITKYKVDGSSAYIDLTTIADNAKQPNWSPKGNKILYQQEEAAGWAIWTMDIDGQNKMQIIGPPVVSATDAAFSADGEWIIYSGENSEIVRANLFKIPVEGGSPIRLTRSTAYDGAPSIASDNSKIAFESINADPDLSSGTAIWLLKPTTAPLFTLPSNQWHQITLPTTPPTNANTVTALFGDDISGEYGTDWIMFYYNPNSGKYIDLGTNGVLKQGVGYWIMQVSNNDVVLDLPDNMSPGSISQSPQCASVNGCYEIDLTEQNNANKWRMLGNPFASPIVWADLRITTSSGECANSDGCTLDEAENQGIFHNQGWSYNPVTKKYDLIESNVLVDPWKGFWGVLLETANGLAPKLLVPLK